MRSRRQAKTNTLGKAQLPASIKCRKRVREILSIVMVHRSYDPRTLFIHLCAIKQPIGLTTNTVGLTQVSGVPMIDQRWSDDGD